MPKMKNFEGNIPLIPLAKMIAKAYDLDEDDIVRRMMRKFPQIKDETRCPNCQASMAMRTYELDVPNFLLLKEMGMLVDSRMKEGMTLDEANVVHIQKQLDVPPIINKRQTQIFYLGLIDKIRGKNGAHDTNKGWFITPKGFDFLSGLPVTDWVTVLRKEIVDQSLEKKTVEQIIESYSAYARDKIMRRKPLKNDWREKTRDYDSNYFVRVAGYARGDLY